MPSQDDYNQWWNNYYYTYGVPPQGAPPPNYSGGPQAPPTAGGIPGPNEPPGGGPPTGAGGAQYGAPGPTNPNDPAVVQYGGYYAWDYQNQTYKFVPAGGLPVLPTTPGQFGTPGIPGSPSTPATAPPPHTGAPGAPVPPATGTPPSSPSGSGGGFDYAKLISPILGLLAAHYGTKPTGAENDLSKIATAPYGSNTIQGFLPGPLQSGITDPILLQALLSIQRQISNPGGLSPGVAEAILPRQAAESQNVATNFQGIRANQEGAAARNNLPVSIKTALGSALDVAQERAQRGVRNQALQDSEALRRSDTASVYPLLDTLLQFTQSGRGGAITGLGEAAKLAQNRQASGLAGIGSVLSGLGNKDWFTKNTQTATA